MRPQVELQTPNQIARLRQHLDTTLPRFCTLPGVAGITLNGGMARGYADHLSEIDVTLYLAPDAYVVWQAGRAPLETGITMIDGMLYDLKVVDLAAEQSREWDHVTRWDASYAEILHDPEGQVAALYAGKLAQRPDPTEAGGVLFSAWWHYRLAGDIWIYRNDALQGHLMLNGALVEIVKALFLANREYIPHEKWLIHMSRSLPWTPANWDTRLEQAMFGGGPTVTGLQQRQSVLETLWHDIDQYIRTQYAPDLPVPVMQQWFYDLLAWLAQRGTVSWAEWLERARPDVLNMAPFHTLVTVTDDTITLDRAALHAISPERLYAWHYAIVEAVAARGVPVKD